MINDKRMIKIREDNFLSYPYFIDLKNEKKSRRWKKNE